MLRAILSFFSNFTASLLALFVFFLVLPIALIVVLASLAVDENAETKLNTDFATLVINLADPIDECGQGHNALVTCLNENASMSLRSLVARIAKASGDSSNKAIFIHGSIDNSDTPLSYAQVAELRKALDAYATSGKSVVAYLENPSMKDYFCTSVASKIYLNPFSELEFKGLGGNSVFFGNAFKKYGIDATVVKVGKLKSFGEMFTSDKMSDEVRENYLALLQSVWGTISKKIAISRNLSVGAVNDIANNKAMLSAKEALQLKLVDKLAYKDEVIAQMRKDFGKQDNTFAQASIYDYPEDMPISAPSKIAVVYMSGDIVDSSPQQDVIDSARYCKLLASIRNSKKYSGAVIRIDSGGGSAYASEQIRRELELLAKKMPVVVSIGGVTASGGYWIATAGKEIIAESESITGSIGVFSLMFSAQKFADNFGITFDGVKTSPMADIGTLARKPTQAEIDRVQSMTNDVYARFVELVSKSRKIPTADVYKFADGRVFSGETAKQLKLVDKIGGIDLAIERVKKLGASKNASIVELPQRDAIADALEKIVPAIGGEFAKSKLIRTTIETAQRTKNLKSGAYARVPFDFQLK